MAGGHPAYGRRRSVLAAVLGVASRRDPPWPSAPVTPWARQRGIGRWAAKRAGTSTPPPGRTSPHLGGAARLALPRSGGGRHVFHHCRGCRHGLPRQRFPDKTCPAFCCFFFFCGKRGVYNGADVEGPGGCAAQPVGKALRASPAAGAIRHLFGDCEKAALGMANQGVPAFWPRSPLARSARARLTLARADIMARSGAAGLPRQEAAPVCAPWPRLLPPCPERRAGPGRRPRGSRARAGACRLGGGLDRHGPPRAHGRIWATLRTGAGQRHGVGAVDPRRARPAPREIWKAGAGQAFRSEARAAFSASGRTPDCAQAALRAVTARPPRRNFGRRCGGRAGLQAGGPRHAAPACLHISHCRQTSSAPTIRAIPTTHGPASWSPSGAVRRSRFHMSMLIVPRGNHMSVMCTLALHVCHDMTPERNSASAIRWHPTPTCDQRFISGTGASTATCGFS